MITRAREILQNLEGGELDSRGLPRLAGSDTESSAADQLGLFAEATGPEEQRVLDALRALVPERTTPLEALQLLTDLAARLGGDEA